ncbi:MAG: Aminoglycoside phosphotransferase [Paenibacillus sp.]|nr:Aminoglycoside phosphotransferase [Paenibacillus sp.]
MDLSTIKAYIPELQKCSRVAQVFKGFSYDGKYFLYEDGGEQPRYVLRTSRLSQLEQKRLEYEMVSHVYGLGVRTSEPVAFGSIDALDICYMVLGYVKGEDAADCLPSLTDSEQVQVGIQAGRELKLMHELAAPPMDSWHDRRLFKHNRYLEKYRECGIKLKDEAIILAFIEDNKGLMKDRPNRFQHDDFHPSNLIVHNRQYAGVIDFNRFDWGDPYHDFLKIAYFSREVSIPFCRGQIQGYFNGDVPESFWSLYALYSAIIIFPSITWTLQVVPEQIESMLARIQVVLDDHHNFNTVIPGWYK